MKKLFLAAVAFSFITACAHVNPTPSNGLACLATVGEAAANDAIAKIYSIIDNGTSANDTEAQILAALKDAAVAYAPDVWKCALEFVANPDSAAKADSTKSLSPTVATKSAAAAIANDFLNGGAQ